MQWFGHFAIEGLAFPAFMVAFGSLVILRTPSIHTVTDAQLDQAPKWIRWFARRSTERQQRRAGWTITTFAVIVAVARIARI